MWYSPYLITHEGHHRGLMMLTRKQCRIKRLEELQRVCGNGTGSTPAEQRIGHSFVPPEGVSNNYISTA